jgi:hypothetical protein
MKIPDVEAGSPLEAIERMLSDETILAQAAKAIDMTGMTGPIVEIEFQEGTLPSAFRVDATGDARGERPEGWSFRSDSEGDIVPIRHRVPTEYQDAVMEGVASERLIVPTDHMDAAAARLRRAGHPEAAVLMRSLEHATDRTAVVRRVEDLIASLEKVLIALQRTRPSLDLGDEK